MSERSLAPALIELLEKRTIRPALFIYADFPSGARRIWTGNRTITFKGEQWEGVGSVIGFDAFTESVDSGAQGIKAKLNGLDPDLIASLVGDQYQGREVVIYLTFWDEANDNFYEAPAPEIPALPGTLQTETDAWIASASTAGGGTVDDTSKAIADNLVVLLKTKSYFSKIKYFMPLLGPDLVTAITPLLDPDGFGRPTNTNFVDADYSLSTGLQGNGSTKVLTLPMKPSDLDASRNGGLGWWELNAGGAFLAGGLAGTGVGSVEPIGVYGQDFAEDPSPPADTRFVLDLRSTLRGFRWGSAAITFSGVQQPANNRHYYGQRSSSSSRLFCNNGLVEATNIASDSAIGAIDEYMRMMGVKLNTGQVQYWGGRCGVAYITDGSMTQSEIGDLHTVLRDNLMFLTGRVSEVLDPIWRGVMDSDEFEQAPESSSLTLALEHRLVDILRKRELRYTHRDQVFLHSGSTDTGLSRVERIQDTSVPWGKTQK